MKPDWTDAKYKMIHQPKRRWRLRINWQVVLLIAALAAISLQPHAH